MDYDIHKIREEKKWKKRRLTLEEEAARYSVSIRRTTPSQISATIRAAID
jgi:hypothetical protein